MYRKVLVPLDGSELAECALPEVMKLARGGMVGDVILLNVVDIPSLWVAEGLDVLKLKNALLDKAQEYLSGVQSRLSKDGLNVRDVVMEGKTAQTIIDYSRQNAVEMLVLATHGYTGMKQLMFGSVALRVLHDAHVPVLLIRPESCR
jgi:nucleotide-binding universal stress UspA family protein